VWVNVLSAEKLKGRETGLIDQALIQRLVPDVADRDIFLCGPPVMMTGVKSALVNLGVPSDRIYSERFALAA
jgi:ferredoxin-NADP reductase